jgi:exopolysaccharide production protein ExoY
MNAPRYKRGLFLLSDILILNVSFLLIAALKLFIIQYSEATMSELLSVVLWGNLYLTAPWVIIFLIFGFYKHNWKLSFFSVILAVSGGVLILKGIDILISLSQGSAGDIVPTPTGVKLMVAYWCLLLITLYTSRFFVTALFDYLDPRRRAGEESIDGAGYSDKSYGICTGYDLKEHAFGYILGKRIMDLAVGFTAFLFFLPTILIMSLIIKATDPKGGVFFRQYRLGKKGKVFRIFKFRTMVHDAEEILKKDRNLYEEYLRNNFKLSGDRDPRITRIGSFLRKTSLDELPQIFNVLKGDMSLVGPRPIVVDEIMNYDKYTKKFLSVKPGLTGWWQVAGRSNIDYPDRIYLEMYYVEKASLWFDLKIILETIPTVLFGKGAH